MRYHNITKDDMLNGEGLRVVLWLAGCEHACPECHNPITWDENGGLPFDEDAKAELFYELQKPYLSGITLSGGDPLYPKNCDEVAALCKEISQTFPRKSIWMYTGYLYEQVYDCAAMQYVDVLIDGPFVAAKKNVSLHWRGSENQRMIDVKASRLAGTVLEYKT